ncbi:hypothetical protein COCMIDRAFT_111033 [Bipolaris oryzae ATCC 44560]|uniref:Uncharacterized protein n=1 Tax=Bipolaris oryzae ATCC 44560 TaxID=930090 RepID=W6YPN2_COCMI|nr:uncharacterized protein COCMIDRAFT_111033 [Bipolaris oryzae ATCC 44560]EUC39620.1 hypothetical protein COCMIDRAFT_111033 [Bipolaris oryzae ATCC 44560]
MAPQTKTFTLRELDAAIIMLEMTGKTTYTEADVEGAVMTLKVRNLLPSWSHDEGAEYTLEEYLAMKQV